MWQHSCDLGLGLHSSAGDKALRPKHEPKHDCKCNWQVGERIPRDSSAGTCSSPHNKYFKGYTCSD